MRLVASGAAVETALTARRTKAELARMPTVAQPRLVPEGLTSGQHRVPLLNVGAGYPASNWGSP